MPEEKPITGGQIIAAFLVLPVLILLILLMMRGCVEELEDRFAGPLGGVMMTKRERAEVVARRRQVAWQAKRDVAQVLPTLKKDLYWRWATGKWKPADQNDYQQARSAVRRLTKKAVRLLFPQYAVRCWYGSGTAHYWVHVNIQIPEGAPIERGMAYRAKEMLVGLGIQYGTYWPDSLPGKDKPRPCLAVEINSITVGMG